MAGVGIRVDALDGGVVGLTLDRPAKRHALSTAVLAALTQAVTTASAARAFLIRAGPGPVFCAGFDVEELAAVVLGQSLPDDRVADALDVLSLHRAPSVAVIEGAAFGAGVELASACDFRVASPKASFCIPASRLGVVYGHRGVERVARVVGLQKARRIFLRGDEIDAATALEWGLVDVVTEHAADEGEAWAAHLAAQAPIALEGMKAALQIFADGHANTESLAQLHALKMKAATSEDVREGLLARREKRPPRFTGR